MRYQLKVGVSTTPASFLVPRLREEMARSLPEVEVSFEIGDSSTIRDRVLAQQVELGLVGAHFDHPDLHCEPFLEGDQLVVIVPPGSPLAHLSQISVRQLREEPFIARPAGSGTRLIYEPYLAAAGAPLSSLQVVREAPDTEAAVEAVASGEGVSIVSLLAAREAAEAGRVKALRLEGATLVRNLYLILHARVELSLEAARFVDILRECRERCHHLPPVGAERPEVQPPAGT